MCGAASGAEVEMVYVPAGEFVFGADEPPAQNLAKTDYFIKTTKVRLEGFHIDRHEVANAEYARFVTATGRRAPAHWKGAGPPKGTESLPVVCVSYEDAAAYAEWCGKRLPTEQEWEYAARGSDGRRYPWGNDAPAPQFAVYGRNTSGPVAVGSCPAGASVFGCLDMAGNVFEWTATPVPNTSEYIVRGAEWTNVAENLQCSRRFAAILDTCSPDLGFRCAADALPPRAGV